MTRFLLAAVLCSVTLTGCGQSGANATPEKATPEMIEAQKKQQLEADEGERQWQKDQKKQK